MLTCAGIDVLNAHNPVTQWECYKGAVEAFENKCGRFTDYGLKHAHVLANICELGFSADAVAVAARRVCPI